VERKKSHCVAVVIQDRYIVEMKKKSSNATNPEPIANFQDILGNTVNRKNVVVRSLKRSARRVTLRATRFENIAIYNFGDPVE
jgi:hypothetical protein